MFSAFFRRFKVGVNGIQERVVALGYFTYLLLGTTLLLLPFCRQGSQGGGLVDNLFTAVSALSTTGLSTMSISSTYSFCGQLVILCLIQAGGLGYMTISSYVILAVSGRISPFRRDIATAVLSPPHGFELYPFLRSIIIFTILIELAGTIALYPSFANAGLPCPWWQAIFHSVSAFCTAGFSLLDNSFENFRDNIWLNIVIMVLSYLGAVGFIVINDWWIWLNQRKYGMTLTSKIILWCTAAISVIGTALFTLNEPSVAGLPLGERLITSWFQVMSASTTVGFNTIPIGTLSGGTLFLLSIVMIIGASPAGTGGGLKTTSVTALWSVMISVLRRDSAVRFAGRIIPLVRIRVATAAMMFYLFSLAAGIYLLTLVEAKPLPELVFECASALGTVGLSCGITSALSIMGKIILIVLMFVGRVGPLALGIALFSVRHTDGAVATEDVVV